MYEFTDVYIVMTAAKELIKQDYEMQGGCIQFLVEIGCRFPRRVSRAQLARYLLPYLLEINERGLHRG